MESENKKLEIKLQNEVESLKGTVTKLENTNKELQCQCQALNAENLNMKKVQIISKSNQINYMHLQDMFLTGAG